MEEQIEQYSKPGVEELGLFMLTGEPVLLYPLMG
jgi:hypothetical protein